MHVIVFFDIEEAIEMSDVNEDTLLNEDNNGDSVMDYCAKYNSKKCFEKILNFYSPKSFALFIIEKDKKFIEKCLIYNSTQILIDLLMNIILKEEVTKMLEQFKNIINTYMPNMNAPGAVKKGEVELVAGTVLKNTLKAAVLKGIKIKPKKSGS